MEFEYVTEFPLLVALDVRSLLSCPVFGEGHCCINRLRVFTWGFLLDQFVEAVANPLGFFFYLAKDYVGMHSRML
jgi:hypothetical protein